MGGNTLLRLVRRAVLPYASELAPGLRALSVNDLAFRRSSYYGTILVDLDQHRVIDIPSQTAQTANLWAGKLRLALPLGPLPGPLTWRWNWSRTAFLASFTAGTGMCGGGHPPVVEHPARPGDLPRG
jgi:hypothetical protein